MHHSRLTRIVFALSFAAACDNPVDVAPGRDAGPMCVATATSEVCGNGVDDDCDAYVDCLDPDCEAQSCGEGALMCTGGSCRRPCDPTSEMCFPEAPALENLRVTVRGDTALVQFEPVDGARDYRIYVEPSPADLLLGADGEVGARNAIYRCAGDRPIMRREDDTSAFFNLSFTAAENIGGYLRTESEEILGHVFLTPGVDREPVYRVGDPNGNGGYTNPSWMVPPALEFTSADYVVGVEARDRLLAEGWRDDGIAFYAPTSGSRFVSRVDYARGADPTAVFYVTPGPEADHFATTPSPPAERFRVLEAASEDSVPLHRVFYFSGSAHDVLAPGEARFQRALHQGNQPITSLTWSGLTETTQLVVEALDSGCPYLGQIGGVHVGAASAFSIADYPDEPIITIDEARLSSGEVFINGQHDPANRPRPIARSFVTASPAAAPDMDWHESFNGTWQEPEQLFQDGNATTIYRNDRFSIEFWGAHPNQLLTPLMGQLQLGSGAGGEMHVIPRDVDAQIGPGQFLHVRMSADLASTNRRYPQIMISTTQIAEPEQFNTGDMPVTRRLGPLPDVPGFSVETNTTMIVQPFNHHHELQVEFCDQRGWGVSQQCPRAAIYGHHAGNDAEVWDSPWLPVPVIGELVGFDRPVQFDVYASTERIYVFIEDRPAGCAVVPAGRMPAGSVTVLFGSVGYHIEIDESVVGETQPHQYLQRHSLNQIRRTFDDLGIDVDVPAPGWDESTMPCATRWY